ncbi:hypothetical protein ACLB2K_066306 [Fragaria x ananassa]
MLIRFELKTNKEGAGRETGSGAAVVAGPEKCSKARRAASYRARLEERKDWGLGFRIGECGNELKTKKEGAGRETGSGAAVVAGPEKCSKARRAASYWASLKERKDWGLGFRIGVCGNELKTKKEGAGRETGSGAAVVAGPEKCSKARRAASFWASLEERKDWGLGFRIGEC